MAEIFAVGTFWFWALVVAEIILLFIFTENKHGWGGTISLVVFAGLLQWCGSIDIFGFMATNPLKIVAFVLSYVALGLLWAIYGKWVLLIRDQISDRREAEEQWLESRGLKGKVLGEREKAEITDYLDRAHPQPLIKNHKADFCRWATFWWISMAWFFGADLIRRVYNEIYKSIAAYLQRISDKMWAKAFKQANVQPPTNSED